MAENTIYIDGTIASLDDLGWEALYDMGPGKFCTYDDVKYQIDNLIPPGTRNVTLYINSPGGNLYEGYRIFNLLNNSGYSITVEIDAMCASIATLIAMAGKKIRMNELARFCIHNPYLTSFSGTANDLESAAEELRSMENDLAKVYASRSGKDEKWVKDLMNQDKMLTAAEAVEFGFVDEVMPALKVVAFYRKSENIMSEIPTSAQQANGFQQIMTGINALLARIKPKAEVLTESAPAETETDTETPEQLKERIAALEAQLTAANEKAGQLDAVQSELATTKTELNTIHTEVVAMKNQLTATFGTALNLTPVANVIDTKPVKEEVREGFRIPSNTIEKMKAKARAEGFDIKPRQPQNK